MTEERITLDGGKTSEVFEEIVEDEHGKKRKKMIVTDEELLTLTKKVIVTEETETTVIEEGENGEEETVESVTVKRVVKQIKPESESESESESEMVSESVNELGADDDVHEDVNELMTEDMDEVMNEVVIVDVNEVVNEVVIGDVNGEHVVGAGGDGVNGEREEVLDVSMEDEDVVCECCKNDEPPGGSENVAWIACDFCDKWFHFVCAKIKNNSNTNDIWTCHSCSNILTHNIYK
jgi:hypothetical protein